MPVAGVAVGLVIVIRAVLLRRSTGGRGRYGSRSSFSSAYPLVVALEIVALFGGGFLLNGQRAVSAHR